MLNSILLIDDNDASNYLNKLNLERAGVAGSINTFREAEKALKYIQFILNEKNKLPDVIFIDINMPKMNGWEFLEEFRKINASKVKKPIIFLLSTYARPEEAKMAKTHDLVNQLIIKPLTVEAIQKVLKTI